MTPKAEIPPEQTTAVNRPLTKEIDPNKPYVLVMSGQEVAAVVTALDATGRGAGADAGEFFWQVRGKIKQQMFSEETTEASAAGLISGREAQRAEERKKAIAEEAAKAAADKTAAKRLKK